MSPRNSASRVARTAAARTFAAAALAGAVFASVAATPQQILAELSARAGTAPVPSRGEQLFTRTHGQTWSCSSCHGDRPTGTGTHASTGKPIAALAPAANDKRFTDPAKVEKWFRRNCNDVVGRECTPAEKADVLAWLVGLKP